MAWKAFWIGVLGTVLSSAVEAGGAELVRARLVWSDFDGDGLQDVYVVRSEDADALFQNLGDGSFQDVTAQALPCVECASIEAAWQDVDRDRRPDLLRLLVSGSVELLRNRGDGVFEDVTVVAGLERVSGASAGRWLDYDADGRADLEIVTERAVLLFQNLGDFLFEKVVFSDAGGALERDGPRIRATPGALEEQGGSAPHPPEPESGTLRHEAASPLEGSRVAQVPSDPSVIRPPEDPSETSPEIALSLAPIGKRCALSVKDTTTGDCVLVSTMPTLGRLYPISANFFVSTGGDVGIGTTSPAAKLDVAGTARIADTLTLAPSADTALDVSTGSIYKGGALFIHTRGGTGNAALGVEALAKVTSSGERNTASGYQALYEDLGGDSNTASGYQALFSNRSDFNTASGYQALRSNTIGRFNTASGTRALFSGLSGDYNTATGNQALYAGGSTSTATGHRALFSGAGARNTATGAEAMSSNRGTGNDNTATGHRALFSNTTGDRNTATGARSLHSNTTGSNNTATGYRALYSNTTGIHNTANGYRALYSNTTGYRNTACGDSALSSNTTGNFNTALGLEALLGNTTGTLNTAAGFSALSGNTVGSRNSALGVRTLSSNTAGNSNTATGYWSLRDNTTGSYNTASGYRALLYNTTGSRNTAVGYLAGRDLTTGDDNIAIGNPGVAGGANTIWIGTPGTHTKTFVAGIRGVTTNNANAIAVLVDSNGQLGTVSSSRRFKRDIADMGDATERLLELRPVVFRYQQAQEVPSGEAPLEYGLIAEEVAEIFPDLVVYDEEGLPFTVKYHLLSSMLLNELKKLREQLDAQNAIHSRELEASALELENLRGEWTRLRGLEARFAAIERTELPR